MLSRRFSCAQYTRPARIEWMERRTLAGAALRLRGPKPRDGLAAAVAEGGGSQTLAKERRREGGDRKEAEDMGGAG